MSASINPKDVDIDAVRDYARDRAERSSIRQLAGEIGLGHSTVHNFLNGAAPHPRVRRVVVEWYLATTGRTAEYSEQAYAAALDVLLGQLPPDRRGRARANVLAELERVHADLGVPVPEWLATLRQSDEA